MSLSLMPLSSCCFVPVLVMFSSSASLSLDVHVSLAYCLLERKQSLAVSQYRVRVLRSRGLGSTYLASPDFEVQTSENASTYLQLEQQRTR